MNQRMKPRIALPIPNSIDLAYSERAWPVYAQAIMKPAARPVTIPLTASQKEIADLINSCQGVLLPGSPADTNPQKYGAEREPECGRLRPGARERGRAAAAGRAQSAQADPWHLLRRAVAQRVAHRHVDAARDADAGESSRGQSRSRRAHRDHRAGFAARRHRRAGEECRSIRQLRSSARRDLLGCP